MTTINHGNDLTALFLEEEEEIAIKLGNVPGLRLLFIAGLAVGIMVSLESRLVNSQGCLEHDIGVCLSPSDIKVDPDVELSLQAFGDVLGSFAPPISGRPGGLAHDGVGGLYLADNIGMVHHMDVLGTPISNWSYLPHTGFALVGVTTDGTHLYLTDLRDRDVDIYTLVGEYVSSFSVASQTTFPEDITYNSFTSNLYVVDADASGGDHVLEYTTTGTLVNSFPLLSTSTDGITFDPTRCTYWVYDSGSDSITHYDPAFNRIETFLGIVNAGFSAGEGLTVIGDVLYVAAFGSSRVVAFDIMGADNSFVDTCHISTAIDLTAQKSNDVNNLGQVGIAFNWTINLANTGPTEAIFESGEVLLQDVLPSGPTYGLPTADNFSDITGSGFIACTIENHMLTCTANSGPVTIGGNGSLDVVFSTTPTISGTLENPAPGGICQIDPTNTQPEVDENNNNCIDSVTVEEEQPTAIDLVSFEVEANSGQAIITWETATELDNAGFNIYRASSSDGPWLQINSVLITAEGDPVSGAHYTFTDIPGRGTFYYRLEDIDFFGISTIHQPVLVDMGAAIRIPWYRPLLPEFE